MKKSTNWKLAGLKILVGLLLYLLSCSERVKNVAAARDSIHIQIDLTNIIDDKIQIIVDPINYNNYLEKVGLILNNGQIEEMEILSELQLQTKECWLNQ